MMSDPDEALEGNLDHYQDIHEVGNDREKTFLNIGRERFISDRRQLGGLCLVLGTCATFQPLGTIASLVGVEDVHASNTRLILDTIVLTSAILQFLFGTLAMVVGYLSLVHGYGNYRLTGSLIIFTQLAWMPFITGMVEIGQAASAPFTTDTIRTTNNGTVLLEDYIVNPFIPPTYLPTRLDVQFFGAMGILGIVAYGTGFLGSLAFTEFALYAFDVGKPTHRDARYFRGRLVFFSFVLALAGVSQLLLGSYVLFEIGSGPLSPPVEVAMYKVHYPEISVAVGSMQMIVGYIGIARYLSYLPVGPDDHEMQGAALLVWFFQLVLQYIVQNSLGMEEDDAAALPSLALLSLGMNILPAYLDYRMRTTPHYLTNEYYGLSPIDTDAALDDANISSTKSKTGKDWEIPRDVQDLVAQDPVEHPEEVSVYEKQGEIMPPVLSDIEQEFKMGLDFPVPNQSVNVMEEDKAEDGDALKHVASYECEDANGVTYDINPTIVAEEYLFEVSNEHGDGEHKDNTKEPGENVEEEEEEGAIIVEEFVEYPEDYVLHDHDNGTLQESKKPSEEDKRDTWKRKLTPMRLSPLQEEESDRMLTEELDDGDPDTVAVMTGEEQSSIPRGSEVLEGAKDPVPTSARSVISDYSMDYSTPSDDSVALEAKINRLQLELLSDFNMESYLNDIL
jgi:hypothetical protein